MFIYLIKRRNVLSKFYNYLTPNGKIRLFKNKKQYVPENIQTFCNDNCKELILNKIKKFKIFYSSFYFD